jgi:Fur family zinc uptake transcriptional regulator
MTAIGFGSHDHRRCIGSALAAAETACRTRGIQLTETRRRVLEILLAEHRALGAYDILARLGAEGRAAQPPVAYRALDFLVREGFAHKIERLAAWVACVHPEADHAPAFLICRSCDTVAEAEVGGVGEALARAAAAAGFRLERAVVEATGLCPECGAAPAKAQAEAGA